MATTTRRTRVLRIPQSHGGCYSCKTRKVKCDMVKPVCGRCVKAKRVCEGYEDRPETNGVVVYAYSRLPAASSSPSTSLSPDLISTTTHCGTFDVLRFASLGCTALHRGALRQYSTAQSFWSVTIPQLGRNDATVGASMAALGAAIEFSQSPGAGPYLRYVRQYGHALEQVQEAIVSTSHPRVPLVAACLLVAVSEVVMGQEPSALSHLKGTLALVQQRHRTIEGPTEDCLRETDTTCNTEEDFVLLNEVDAAGALLDLVTATYALGLEPRLPRLSANRHNKGQDGTKSLYAIEFQVLETLHDSYRFGSKHFQWKYVPHPLAPVHIYIDQSRFTGQLFQRIQELRDLRSRLNAGSPEFSRALTLSAQSTACLIYLSALFDPHETAYDSFAASFRSIVDDAEVVIGQQKDAESDSSVSISLDLGIIQPLFITACKYRDHETRCKAISLLEKGGRDGPWDGKICALLARRVVELEQQAIIANDDKEGVIHALQIPEAHRLYSAGAAGVQPNHSHPQAVEAWFSRCKDIELMMATASPDAYKDESNWEVWNEMLPWSTKDDL